MKRKKSGLSRLVAGRTKGAFEIKRVQSPKDGVVIHYVTNSLQERRILRNDSPLQDVGKVKLVRPPVRISAATRKAIRAAVRNVRAESAKI